MDLPKLIPVIAEVVWRGPELVCVGRERLLIYSTEGGGEVGQQGHCDPLKKRWDCICSVGVGAHAEYNSSAVELFVLLFDMNT